MKDDSGHWDDSTTTAPYDESTIALVFRLQERENDAYWQARRAFDEQLKAIRKKARADAETPV